MKLRRHVMIAILIAKNAQLLTQEVIVYNAQINYTK